MVSLDTYKGKKMLLSFLFLAISVSHVGAIDYLSLNTSSPPLGVGDRLISMPNSYMEFGIFPYNYSQETIYQLSIRYAAPIETAVTWLSNRSLSLTGIAALNFSSTGLLLSDPSNDNSYRDNVWSAILDNRDGVTVQLNDSGRLEILNANKTLVWNSFDHSAPTDTLLPGQHMYRNQSDNLTSFQKTGDPAIVDGTYTFGWDAQRVLGLFWKSPTTFLEWKGGHYIPAPDVFAAHTIQNVDTVYFHERLGHLYIGSDPPTAILSGGPDPVNSTKLKRITLFPDGGLRILQWTVYQTVGSNQTSNQTWEVVANWVVSDRPESRSQCTVFGTCGKFSECVPPIDDLGPVTCRCAGMDQIETRDWFTPVDPEDPSRGCHPPIQQADCTPLAPGTNRTNVDMLELPGRDMPWGGDYRNLTGDASADCRQACINDCLCAGAVWSEDEKMCWLGNGAIYNLGYPTVALHGTSRISYLRNQNVLDAPLPPKPPKEDERAKVVALAVGIPAAVLLVLGIVALGLNRRVRQRVRGWGAGRRRDVVIIDLTRFPGDQPGRSGRGGGGEIELSASHSTSST